MTTAVGAPDENPKLTFEGTSGATINVGNVSCHHHWHPMVPGEGWRHACGALVGVGEGVSRCCNCGERYPPVTTTTAPPVTTTTPFVQNT